VNWYPKVFRKDYAFGLNMTASAIDDPDQQFYENYACGAQRNITGYCNSGLEKMFARQSTEPDHDKRKELVWESTARCRKTARGQSFFTTAPRAAFCVIGE
jgi:peptide/nickel transport system substrate-binding protein